METGIAYPKITLGTMEYEIKFTRATMYRMGKMGVRFNPQITAATIALEFSQLVDVLHLATGFPGTAEDLAELCFDIRHEIVVPLVEAWAKVVLPSMRPIRETAAPTQPDQRPN